MAADEHLNKVIRNLPESHISRMQVLFLKKLKAINVFELL